MRNRISLARICDLQIEGLKNVRNGELKFYPTPAITQNKESALEGHVFGIYGPNGSGKTSVVDALWILKVLLSGGKPDSESYHKLSSRLKKYINASMHSLSVSIVLYFQVDEEQYLANYSIDIGMNGDDPVIQAEKLRVKEKIGNEWDKYRPVFDYSRPENHISIPSIKRSFLPKLRALAQLSSNMAPLTSLLTGPVLEQEFDEDITDEEIKGSKLFFWIQILRTFAQHYLIVVEAYELNSFSENLMSLILSVEEEDMYMIGKVPILSLDKSLSSVPSELFETFVRTFEQMNIILQRLVPGTRLEMQNIREVKQKNNLSVHEFECVSVRGDERFSVSCESEGIKRLIAVIDTLIAFTKNSRVCLVIDEFDAGIYEFLFGILVETLDETGKGQLIFTAHNLRGVEKLPYKQIFFSTTNPDNRFERQTAMENNNKRSLYFRNIVLGKDKGEELADLPTSNALKMAFRKANRIHG